MPVGLLLAEGARIVLSGLARKLRGARRYDGTAEDICRQIVWSCFDTRRRYFRASRSTYTGFWARDFGRSAGALCRLGFAREVGETYAFALARYQAQGWFALVITPSGTLFDFPAYAPDGFAFLLHGLAQLEERALVIQYRDFLVRETERFVERVIDRKTGLVRRQTHFSEAQDYALRSSSCYSNVMCFLLQQSLTALELPNPLSAYDYPRLIAEQYWDGGMYRDDATRPSYVSGDACLLPFWSGLDADRSRLDLVLERLDAAGLNDPLPTRYGVDEQQGRNMIALERVNHWQRDAVWTCLGLHYLETLQRFAHPRYLPELARYEAFILAQRCFPEVLDSRSGKLFRSLSYMSEDSMLWAANLWLLLHERA